MISFNPLEFQIFGISGYFFFAGIGVTLATCLFIVLLFQKNFPVESYFKIFMFSNIAMILCAKLFGTLTAIYYYIGIGEAFTLSDIANRGIVFYGGLIGFLTCFYVICRIKHLDLKAMDLLGVCIPLFHCFARIGCFTTGCCFGIESNSLISINYTTYVLDEIVTASRLPIQLIEALFNLILFGYLFYLYRTHFEYHLLRRYLLIYSCGRFILEFFRGDVIRGIINGISFSQVVSVLIWIFLGITFLRNKKIKGSECL